MRACPVVAARHPPAHLVFVGQGPMTCEVAAAAARAGVGDRVHLVGQRADVEHWLAAASAWFLPTESEGFSLALLEAMAARRGIVTTACEGNVEVLADGRNALLTPVGDTEAMARALDLLLADPALRAGLGAAAQADVGRYSLDAMVEQHLACYAPLLQRAVRTPRGRTRIRRQAWLTAANVIGAAVNVLGPLIP